MGERVEIPQSSCRAGVHSSDITPPVGIYHRMWGAATHDRSEGVSMPLRQTTLVLAPLSESDGELHAFVAVDHCLLWHREMQALLAHVEQATGLRQDQVTLLFSHTHAAGLMGSERAELDGGDLIAPYLEWLAGDIARSVNAARSRLQPASIVYGTGRCDLARNRDYLDPATDSYVCGYNPHGEADDTVVVGRVVAETSVTPLAILVNYACHPTTLAWANRLISPDYIGGLREVIETETAAPLFFVQGASGDIGPRESYVGDTQVAYRNGRQLGFAALAALETLPAAGTGFEYTGAVVSGATLGTWKWSGMTSSRTAAVQEWAEQRPKVELAYRDDLPVKAELLSELEKWKAAEQDAQARNDETATRDARAMAERMTRRLTRVEHLDDGTHFSYEFRVWKMGDVVWVALNGEHYNHLQRDLRNRFPDTPIVIATLANGSSVWYLPDSESYGKGLYQEDASILAKGSLEALREKVIEAVEICTGRAVGQASSLP